jgi:hypothetical protein
LGSKRSALATKRAKSTVMAAGRKAALAATDDSFLVSANGAATFLLCVTNYGLLVERTQNQGACVRFFQTMVFRDVKTFDFWCSVEPQRFEDVLLFNQLVRKGHEAFADKP